MQNATQVARHLRTVNSISLSTQTIHRGLKKQGMKAIKKPKKPYLRPHHKRMRMEFAEKYKDWTVEDWKRVIWSDETKINCLGSDGETWGWKNPGEELSDRLVQGTVKFKGGFLMIWGCMSWESISYAIRIDGRIDADLYVSILVDELQKSIKHFKKKHKEVIFQQDNDPKHTSKKA